MSNKIIVAAMLLGCLLVSASAHPHHRHILQEDPLAAVDASLTTPTAPVTIAAAEDEFRIDPTPGPIEFDPVQAGRRNGFYRYGIYQLKSC